MPSNRFYPNNHDRSDTGSMPCAGGSCPAPGGTPSFLSLSPMYALRRRAQITGRIPHGRLRKPVEPCYRLDPDSRWEESLPWRPSQLCSEFNHDQKILGQYHRKSQFRSLTRCGALRTKKACERDDIGVDFFGELGCETNPCEPDICDSYMLEKCEKYPFEKQFEQCTSSCRECESESDVESECLSVCSDCPNIQCPPCENPRQRFIDQKRRWDQQRRSFKPSRARSGNPSGRFEPISETMRGSQPFANQSFALDWKPQNRFRRQSASKNFVGGDPEAFCNSTRIRFAGSNGPKEIRAAICQIGPQGRPGGCGC